MNHSSLPVAVIGAGPVGLAAAAHLADRGEPFVVLEAGPSIGYNVLSWGHVRVFSPWKYNVDSIARAMLEQAGWRLPHVRIAASQHTDTVEDGAHLEAYPTGRELVEQYLRPLADLPQIRPHLRLEARVTSVTRLGFDKMKTPGREQAPFLLRVEDTSGEERDLLARAVIDASGTYDSPNPLGASGVPAAGETRLTESIVYRIPDVLHRDWSKYAGKRVLVVGSGHSAFNTLLDLANLAWEEPETTISWAIRRDGIEHLYGGGKKDHLPARSALGQRLRRLVEEGRIQLLTNIRIERLVRTEAGVAALSQGQALPPVDEIVATTGFRPDLSLAQELRLAVDPGVESPAVLAPLIDPNLHSCGTVPPHGVDELSHPERDFYIVGMKSYGRAPTFLLLTGYEQVRSVVAALVGDWESARDVRLVLPETGVCSVDRKALTNIDAFDRVQV